MEAEKWSCAEKGQKSVCALPSDRVPLYQRLEHETRHLKRTTLQGLVGSGEGSLGSVVEAVTIEGHYFPHCGSWLTCIRRIIESYLKYWYMSPTTWVRNSVPSTGKRFYKFPMGLRCTLKNELDSTWGEEGHTEASGPRQALELTKNRAGRESVAPASGTLPGSLTVTVKAVLRILV